MNEPLYSLDEIAEAFKYIQDNRLSTDARAMLTMDIGYEKAENDIVKLLEDKRREIDEIVTMSDELGETSAKWFYQDRARDLNNYIALIKGESK